MAPSFIGWMRSSSFLIESSAAERRCIPLCARKDWAGGASLYVGEHRGSGLRRSGKRMGRVFAGVQRQDRQLVLWSGASN